MKRSWILDSGCSRHMMGDISLLFDLVAKKKGFVTYSDNNKGAILGKGSVGNPSSTIISDVLLVEGLKHNLISISQLCDKVYKVSFSKDCCLIENSDKDNVFKGLRVNNVYMLDLNEVSLTDAKCLVSMSEDSWLWHRRLELVNFYLLNKIVSKDLVVGLSKIEFSKDHLCDACQMGKQIKNFF